MDQVRRAVSAAKTLWTPKNNTSKSKSQENAKEIPKQLHNLLHLLNNFCDASTVREFIEEGFQLEKCCCDNLWLLDVLKQKCYLILDINDSIYGSQTFIKKCILDNLLAECYPNILYPSNETFIFTILIETYFCREIKYSIDLSGLDLSFINLEEIKLYKTNLRYTNLSNTKVRLKNLSGSNLAGATYITYLTSESKFSNYDPYIAIECINATIESKIIFEDKGLCNVKENLRCLYEFLKEFPDKSFKYEFILSHKVAILSEKKYDYIEFKQFKSIYDHLWLEYYYKMDYIIVETLK